MKHLTNNANQATKTKAGRYVLTALTKTKQCDLEKVNLLLTVNKRFSRLALLLALNKQFMRTIFDLFTGIPSRRPVLSLGGIDAADTALFLAFYILGYYQSLWFMKEKKALMLLNRFYCIS